MQVIKKDGRLQELDANKIKISILNATSGTKALLNESDIKIIVKDIIKIIEDLRSEYGNTSSYEIVGVVVEVLKRDGFDYTKSIIDGETKWNDTAMKEVFELMNSWREKGYLGENITTLDSSGEQSLFLNGDTPMHLNGSWFMNQVNDSDNPERVGFIAFPYFEKYPENKNNWHSGTSEGFSLSATNGEERLQASIKLLKYLTDEEAYNESQALSKGGIYPVTTMKEIDDITPIAKEFNEAKLEPGDYAAKAQLREEIRDAIQGMFAGTSVDDTLARIQKVTDME